MYNKSPGPLEENKNMKRSSSASNEAIEVVQICSQGVSC